MATTTEPRTDWKERIEEGEEARLIAHAEALRAMQRKQAGRGHADRALHAKQNAGVLGELAVLANLPAHARAGLFAHAGSYPTYVRFSNGSGARQSDTKGDVRGAALKVVGVTGKKIIAGMEDAKTQDFLFIRTPTIPFRNPDEFVGVVTAAAAGQALLLPRAIARLGFGRALDLLPKLARGLKEPTASIAATRWFTAVPIRYGDLAAKLTLVPHTPDAAPPREPRTANWLGEDLAERLRTGAVTWDLCAQFWTDEISTPIEDPTVTWSEERAPLVTVGRLTLPEQDLGSPRARRIAEYIDKLSFDPWHALVEHRPLGSIMRARNHAYRLSTAERHAAPEPDGTEVHG